MNIPDIFLGEPPVVNPMPKEKTRGVVLQNWMLTTTMITLVKPLSIQHPVLSEPQSHVSDIFFASGKCSAWGPPNQLAKCKDASCIMWELVELLISASDLKLIIQSHPSASWNPLAGPYLPSPKPRFLLRGRCQAGWTHGSQALSPFASAALPLFGAMAPAPRPHSAVQGSTRMLPHIELQLETDEEYYGHFPRSEWFATETWGKPSLSIINIFTIAHAPTTKQLSK